MWVVVKVEMALGCEFLARRGEGHDFCWRMGRLNYRISPMVIGHHDAAAVNMGIKSFD